MTLYLTRSGEVIEARIRADGPGMVGDALLIIRPGEEVLGLTYEALLARAPGEIEVPDAPEARG